MPPRLVGPRLAAAPQRLRASCTEPWAAAAPGTPHRAPPLRGVLPCPMRVHHGRSRGSWARAVRAAPPPEGSTRGPAVRTAHRGASGRRSPWPCGRLRSAARRGSEQRGVAVQAWAGARACARPIRMHPDRTLQRSGARGVHGRAHTGARKAGVRPYALWWRATLGGKARNNSCVSVSPSPKPARPPAARVGKDSKLIMVQLWLFTNSHLVDCSYVMT